MNLPSSRPTVFVGSSTRGLTIANEVRRGLDDVANVIVWNTAFAAGTWLLGGILRQAQQSDFGIFVIRKDDKLTLKNVTYSNVRDNVLFEAGIFMGALGPERTILLWPSGKGSDKLRLPTDLEGLLREHYTPAKRHQSKPKLQTALASIRRRIETMGLALRSGYNEIAALKQALHERDIEFVDGSIEGLGDIVMQAAQRRRRPWFASTDVDQLTKAVEVRYHEDTVDLVFWWLIHYGVITFDNIEQWSSGDWHYTDSVEYAMFTARGLVLLNEFRSNGSKKRRRSP